jgi:hypothetical protein
MDNIEVCGKEERMLNLRRKGKWKEGMHMGR